MRDISPRYCCWCRSCFMRHVLKEKRRRRRRKSGLFKKETRTTNGFAGQIINRRREGGGGRGDTIEHEIFERRRERELQRWRHFYPPCQEEGRVVEGRLSCSSGAATAAQIALSKAIWSLFSRNKTANSDGKRKERRRKFRGGRISRAQFYRRRRRMK